MEKLPIPAQQQPDNSRAVIDADFAYLQSPNGSPYKKDDIKNYLNIFRRRKWYIILPLIFIISFTSISLLVEESMYETTTRILIENDDYQSSSIEGVLSNNRQRSFDKSEGFYKTEYKLLRSRENLEELIVTRQLQSDKADKTVRKEEPGFVVKMRTMLDPFRDFVHLVKEKVVSIVMPLDEDGASDLLDPAELRRREAVAAFSQSLKIQPQEDTKLVDIRVSGPDPQEITWQANTLVEIYIKKNLEKKLEASAKAATWLTNQTKDLKEKMYEAELGLQALREKKNFISFDLEEKRNTVLSRLDSLGSSYNTSHKDRIDAESVLQSMNKFSGKDIEKAEASSESSQSRIIQNLKQRLLDLQDEYASLSKKYARKHPVIIQKKSQISEVKKNIDLELQKMINAMQEKRNVLAAKEQALAREFSGQKDKALELTKDMIVYNTLKRDTEIYRNLYLEASKKLREIKLAQAFVTNNIQVIEQAVLPIEPVPTKAMITLLLNVIIGCSLGIGFACTREYFDNRFKDANEVERDLQIPFLGVIPHYKTDKRNPYEPVTLQNATSAASEAYRTLRTRLHALSPGLKTLLVTSTIPSEGKSTTTANLGVSFAHLGMKVLLVDVDLRRPSLHRHFYMTKHMRNDVGLTDVLVNGADWQQVIQDTTLPHLKVLSTGITLRNPSDLLSLTVMKTLISTLRDAFDLVLIDAPLILSVPDVEIIAPAIDGVLLVHCPGKCDKASVFKAKKLLETANTNILGVIFNNIEKKELKYYDYHHEEYDAYYKPLDQQILNASFKR